MQTSQTSPDSGQDTIERSEIRQISNAVPGNTFIPEEQCAQIPNSVPVNTVIPEEKCAQHIVHFIDAQDQSDSGSLTTQAPQSSSIRATINALSTWISARESWYLAGWIRDSPIDFLVDPGTVVSAISLQCYEKLVDAGAIHTPLKEMQMDLEAANKSDMACAV